MASQNQNQEPDLNQLLKVRREKLAAKRQELKVQEETKEEE